MRLDGRVGRISRVSAVRRGRSPVAAYGPPSRRPLSRRPDGLLRIRRAAALGRVRAALLPRTGSFRWRKGSHPSCCNSHIHAHACHHHYHSAARFDTPPPGPLPSAGGRAQPRACGDPRARGRRGEPPLGDGCSGRGDPRLGGWRRAARLPAHLGRPRPRARQRARAEAGRRRPRPALPQREVRLSPCMRRAVREGGGAVGGDGKHRRAGRRSAARARSNVLRHRGLRPARRGDAEGRGSTHLDRRRRSAGLAPRARGPPTLLAHTQPTRLSTPTLLAHTQPTPLSTPTTLASAHQPPW